MTKNDILTIVAIIAALSALWYVVITPLARNKETSGPLSTTREIDDNLNNMDATTTQRFNLAMQKANESPAKVMNDQLPDAAFKLISRGTLTPRALNVSGTVSLLDVGGQKILRFENFETANGPDLRVYLAGNLTDKDILDLGAVRATKGNINYNMPTNTDTAKYNYVLVWSKQFRIMFSYAEWR